MREDERLRIHNNNQLVLGKIQTAKTSYPIDQIREKGCYSAYMRNSQCRNSKRFEKNLYFINSKKSINNSRSETIRYHIFDEGAKRYLNDSYSKKAHKRDSDSLSTLATTFYPSSSRNRPGSAPRQNYRTFNQKFEYQGEYESSPNK